MEKANEAVQPDYIISDLWPLVVPIDSIQLDPSNAMQHDDVNLDQIAGSLNKHKQRKPVVINRTTKTVEAGNGTWLAARRLGWEFIAVVGEEDDPQTAVSYSISDNAVASSDWDWERLKKHLDTFDEPDEVPGVDDDLMGLLKDALAAEERGKGGGGAGPQVDEAAALLEKWQVNLGDVWQLGRHKIACIDSLDEGAVRGLIDEDTVGMVWADPPYGINIVDSQGHIGGGNLAKLGNYTQVSGDNTTETAIKAFVLAKKYGGIQIWWGANHYADKLPSSSSWIVWDKENGNNNFADCELAWTNHTGAVRIFRHMWQGMLKASEHGQRRVHPTQKPVVLFEWVATKYFKEGGIVFDPFLGSGISIIGAENMGDSISIIGCEVVPEYIAVCLERWTDLTGGEIKPKLIQGANIKCPSPIKSGQTQ